MKKNIKRIGQHRVKIVGYEKELNKEHCKGIEDENKELGGY